MDDQNANIWNNANDIEHAEDGLTIDAGLVIEAILKDKKPGTTAFYDLCLSLGQGAEEGEYEPAQNFTETYPDYVSELKSFDKFLRTRMDEANLVYSLWHKIYHATSEKKNQIGIDQLMEWGKAFADEYAQFRVDLEKQKTYILYHLPILEQIKSNEKKIKSHEKTIAELKPLAEKCPELQTTIKRLEEENKTLKKDNNALDIVVNRQARQLDDIQNSKQPQITQQQAADSIKHAAEKAKVKLYSRCNTRTIQKWESGENKKPAWYPGRHCELATFILRVNAGLNEVKLNQCHKDAMHQAKRPPIRIKDEQHLSRMTIKKAE